MITIGSTVTDLAVPRTRSLASVAPTPSQGSGSSGSTDRTGASGDLLSTHFALVTPTPQATTIAAATRARTGRSASQSSQPDNFSIDRGPISLIENGSIGLSPAVLVASSSSPSSSIFFGSGTRTA